MMGRIGIGIGGYDAGMVWILSGGDRAGLRVEGSGADDWGVWGVLWRMGKGKGYGGDVPVMWR